MPKLSDTIVRTGSIASTVIGIVYSGGGPGCAPDVVEGPWQPGLMVQTNRGDRVNCPRDLSMKKLADLNDTQRPLKQLTTKI